ncbi:MAG: hypothetical protein ACYTGG_10335 [Planctomycetota bacterium]
MVGQHRQEAASTRLVAATGPDSGRQTISPAPAPVEPPAVALIDSVDSADGPWRGIDGSSRLLARRGPTDRAPTHKWSNGAVCVNGGVSFSNFNSVRQPWIHRDDFICGATGDVIEVRFWGGMWLQGNNCDFLNLESVTINFYEWIDNGPCGCDVGTLLSTNTIPTSDLTILYLCTGEPSGEDHYLMSALLPVPFFQVEGTHYAIEIGGNLIDPDGCFFYWSRPGYDATCAGYSVHLDTGQCISNNDGAFAMFTERSDMPLCGAEITYQNGHANLVNGVNAVGAWDGTGIIDDLVLPQSGGTVFDCFSLDLFAHVDPFPIEDMRIRVYDTSDGGIAALGDPAVEVPLFDHTVTLSSGDLAFTDSGIRLEGYPLLRVTADLPLTDLGPGHFGVFVTFPNQGVIDAFWATAQPHATECAHDWGVGHWPPTSICPDLGLDFNDLAFHFGFTPAEPCGDPATGDCLEPNGTPGCDNAGCCSLICAVDPYCCDTAWDQICADAAVATCWFAPANDNCADLLLLQLQHNVTHVQNADNTGATDDCTPFEGPEVWHAFGVSETMDITIEYCASSPVVTPASTVLSPGCPCPDDIGQFINADIVDLAACGNGNTTLTFYNVPPGDYYYPIMAGPGSTEGPYELHVTGVVVGQPLNDDCIGTLIDFIPPCSTRVWAGNASGATNDCPALNWPEVWHAFSIPVQMDVTIDYCGTPDIGFFYWEFLFPDCTCGNDLVWGVSSYDACPNGRITIEFPDLPAGTYYHAVPYYENTGGVYQVRVSTGPIENPANGHSYCASVDFMTAPQAEGWAQSYGGHLVTIDDEAELQWLVDTFGGDVPYFIGLTDDEAYGGQEAGSDPDNGWVWMSGGQSAYRNWADGEPNDLGGEDFVVMNWVSPGLWNDESAGTTGLAIAEFAPCPADIDGSGAVGVNDLLAVLAAWGPGGGPADLDDDGIVGVTDLLLVLASWGACP